MKTLVVIFRIALCLVPWVALALLPPGPMGMLIAGSIYGLLVPVGLMWEDLDISTWSIDNRAGIAKVVLMTVLSSIPLLLLLWLWSPEMLTVADSWAERGYFALGNFVGVTLLIGGLVLARPTGYE